LNRHNWRVNKSEKTPVYHTESPVTVNQVWLSLKFQLQPLRGPRCRSINSISEASRSTHSKETSAFIAGDGRPAHVTTAFFELGILDSVARAPGWDTRHLFCIAWVYSPDALYSYASVVLHREVIGESRVAPNTCGVIELTLLPSAVRRAR